MNKSLRKLAALLLVLSVFLSSGIMGSNVSVSAEELMKPSEENVISSEDIEDGIESGVIDTDDYSTKAVGADGTRYENVEYLSVGTVSRMDANTRQEYYEICDQVAEELSNDIDADVVIGIDEDGDINLFAVIQIQEYFGGMDTASGNNKDDITLVNKSRVLF